jgi:hypothetical protein
LSSSPKDNRAAYAGTWRGRVGVTYTMQSSGLTYDGRGAMDTIITVSPAGDSVVREDGVFNWEWTRLPPGYVKSGTNAAVVIGPYNVAIEGNSLAWRYDFTSGSWTKHVEATLTLSSDKSTATFVSTAYGTEAVTGAKESTVHHALLTRDYSNAPSSVNPPLNLKK